MMVPLRKCIIIPRVQLPPSILPRLAAMSILTPIIGETKYIINVMTIVPARPPRTVLLRLGLIVKKTLLWGMIREGFGGFTSARKCGIFSGPTLIRDEEEHAGPKPPDE